MPSGIDCCDYAWFDSLPYFHLSLSRLAFALMWHVLRRGQLRGSLHSDRGPVVVIANRISRLRQAVEALHSVSYLLQFVQATSKFQLDGSTQAGRRVDSWGFSWQ